ncbi:uncharacterized protein MONOS_11217 [Monocercomonoides exilis]|uniref:uncharacterized protein n=1 Tax=Monocercomonoides exilis TaxID=2049356 RepID=UPI0035594C63|nr:hypothetical protein MONOS_11217 [Monocercomonoides exilis]|eukprot:MONOS_11217.1-p1 / transcript=MONOS_11217.1 / gene=MONOS_11217 / organism=Monocercomonoides_exilis_PA203 / gene_product=unspecified product / transcript_product=unspecified product / location=Mono_scaffold00551:24295-25415(-) / protein_length=218 / sequence_SO=supercontig / SO=protein_coding / is_pseudo=false
MIVLLIISAISLNYAAVNLKNYDLRDLTVSEDNPYTIKSGNDSFIWNFNKTLKKTEEVPFEDCMVVYIKEKESNCHGSLTSQRVSYLSNDRGLSFTLNHTVLGRTRTAQISLQCSKDTKTNTAKVDGIHVYITMNHPAGCKLPDPISWGSVGLIVFFGGLLLFFLIGIPVQMCRGKRGMEIVPFVFFWVSIPRLVQIGWETLFSPCYTSARGFQEMK